MLVTSVMYHDTAPMPAIRPSGYLLTNCGSRFLTLGSLAGSSGFHRSIACPLSMATWDIIETSAGACFARAAWESWTSHASPVGSEMDWTSMPVALVKSGKMCWSKDSWKYPP